MIHVCREHVKIVLNQFNVPHVETIAKECVCQYCNKKAKYAFYEFKY